MQEVNRLKTISSPPKKGCSIDEGFSFLHFKLDEAYVTYCINSVFFFNLQKELHKISDNMSVGLSRYLHFRRTYYIVKLQCEVVIVIRKHD